MNRAILAIFAAAGALSVLTGGSVITQSSDLGETARASGTAQTMLARAHGGRGHDKRHDPAYKYGGGSKKGRSDGERVQPVPPAQSRKGGAIIQYDYSHPDTSGR